MRSRIVKIALCLMAVVFALGIILIPREQVRADDEDIPVIVPGEELAIDFLETRYWWYKYETTEGKLLQIRSYGKTWTWVGLYEGNQNETSRKKYNHSGAGDNKNFLMTFVAKANVTYYILVTTYNSSSYINPANDTTVMLTDLTNPEVIAKIDDENFPDPSFRAKVKTFEIVEDGILTRDEMELVTSIDLSGKNVTSLKGIEYFEKLRELNCYDNNLETLDVSALKNLYKLDVRSNTSLTSLKITGCTSLRELNCSNCPKLPSKDMTSNNMLKKLVCEGSKINLLDLSKMRYLETLNCTDNNLSSLDVSQCQYLQCLQCGSNNLWDLDVSSCNKLSTLECQDNMMLQDLKLNKKIEQLNVTNNMFMEELDLTGCKRLTQLRCSGTMIETLDFKDCPYLAALHDDFFWDEDNNCYRGHISDIECILQMDSGTTVTVNESDFDPYVEINNTNFPDEVFRNYVSKYDQDSDGWLSKYDIALMTEIYLTACSISSFEGIEYLTSVRELYCGNNNLTELDLSKNPELEILYCGDNKLTKLDFGKNTALRYLHCANNLIEKLDLSKMNKLTDAICINNKLKTLTLGKQTEFVNLVCGNNNLKYLDISNCPNLMKAYEEGEKKVNETTINYVLRFEQNYFYQLVVDKTVKINEKPEATATPTPSATPTATPTSKPTTKPAAVSLTLDKKTAKVVCGKTLTLKATLKGSTSKITWKSSNTKVATVDSKGKITAKMAGEVTITATAAGKSAKCKVTVLYKDVTNTKDFWYAPTNYLTAKGVVKGYDKQTKFKPANKCTRAQMVTFIWRLQGEPKPKAKTCKFKDVKKTDYFFKACIWGNENHIVEGYKDGTFGPQIVCARKHAVTFLWRLANKPKPSSTKNKFKDVKKKDYFYQATLWASEKKILAGYEDGTFRPNGDCLRRQMVTFLYKYDKYVNKKG